MLCLRDEAFYVRGLCGNVLPVLFLLAPAFIFTPAAESASDAVYGGEVHLFGGAVVESSCLVMLDMDELSVDMGHDNTAQFRMVGDHTDTAVSFAIKIRQCSRDVADSISIKFHGIPDKSDPDVFSVSHRADYLLAQNGGHEDHVGLAIFDRNGRQITPGGSASPHSGRRPGQLDSLEFAAKYRAASPVLITGTLESVVWLGIAYF